MVGYTIDLMRQLMRSASVATGHSARLALRSLKGILLECMQNWLRFVNLSAATWLSADGHGSVHAAGTPCSLKAKAFRNACTTWTAAANLEWR